MSVTAKGVALATPSKISVEDEIIWSDDTGRSLTGKMLGDVVATKKKFNITWNYITQAQLNAIRSAMTAGFFNFSALGTTITGYRGTITADCIGQLNDGITYYRTVSADVIQQ